MGNQSEIIARLRDDNEYYGGVGKNYLSNSDVKTLLHNPKEFKAERTDSKEFVLGRYFHQLVLEPDKAAQFLFVDVASRNTKAYKEFVENNNIEVAMLLKEKLEVEEWVRTIRDNHTFRRYIDQEANQFEVPMIGKVCGEMFKGKADILSDEYVYDLKTTSSIQDFKWNARKYGYDTQAFIYQQLFGKPMIFLVIDKTTKMMGMYSVSDESIERGREKVEAAIRVYRKFYGENPTSDIDQFYFYDEI